MFIKIKDLKFKYKNSKKYIINNFSIDIKKGEIVSILGESGSGKSTILRIISGLEEPTDGVLVIDDKILLSDKTFILPENRGVGLVFQDYALFPHMTVSENIKYGLKKLNRKEKNKRLNEVLELVNLEEYKDRYPYELSGGQQQRVALARALAPKPSVILLDEPFSNLDANLQSKIREDLKNILKKTKITTIFVTHDSDDAIKIADKVVILKDGEIVQIGSPKEILDNPKTKYVSDILR